MRGVVWGVALISFSYILPRFLGSKLLRKSFSYEIESIIINLHLNILSLQLVSIHLREGLTMETKVQPWKAIPRPFSRAQTAGTHVSIKFDDGPTIAANSASVNIDDGPTIAANSASVNIDDGLTGATN